MSGTADMRGKKPRLLLFLLLLAAVSATVLCQDGEDEGEGDAGADETPGTTLSPPDSSPSLQTNPELREGDEITPGEGSGGIPGPLDEEPSVDPESTAEPLEEDGLDITIILIPVVLVCLIIAMIAVGLYISRRWNNKAVNKDSRIETDASTSEKVPMPMFEEDVPSVLELEMEELDQWINHDS